MPHLISITKRSFLAEMAISLRVILAGEHSIEDTRTLTNNVEFDYHLFSALIAYHIWIVTTQFFSDRTRIGLPPTRERSHASDHCATILILSAGTHLADMQYRFCRISSDC